MVCLSLSHPQLSRWSATLEEYRDCIDCVELRVDRLSRPDEGPVSRFASELDLPAILTVRREVDGGGYSGCEDDRLDLLMRLLSHGSYAYVDIEDDVPPAASARVEAAAGSSGARVIRSLHDFGGMPEDIRGTLNRLGRRVGEVPKLAVTPRGTKDLHRLLRAYGEARDDHKQGFILLGMGDYGVPTRILSPALGALLTFSSAADAEAAPGHLDPRTMNAVYHVRRNGPNTKLFGIIGNPVLHSKSPHYHNPRFRRDGLDAVYVPFPTDDVDEFFVLAETIGIQGFSVTIPHKEAVMGHLRSVDEASRAAGSCNTVVRCAAGGPSGTADFCGVNTDVPGFLGPLKEIFGPNGLKGLGATVIGAGGASRAVCYALATAGVSLFVVNRTVARAEQLVADIQRLVNVDAATLDLKAGPPSALSDPAICAGSADRDYRDIIVQTTGIGMEPDVGADPAVDLEFRGTEVVYDIIYTPEYTTFLRRAQAAGCRVITGSAMFDGQAVEQYRLFSSLL